MEHGFMSHQHLGDDQSDDQPHERGGDNMQQNPQHVVQEQHGPQIMSTFPIHANPALMLVWTVCKTTLHNFGGKRVRDPPLEVNVLDTEVSVASLKKPRFAIAPAPVILDVPPSDNKGKQVARALFFDDSQDSGENLRSSPRSSKDGKKNDLAEDLILGAICKKIHFYKS
ncbi:hypothetical protein E2562_028347 [Oryza meyeriana var. granulata]|uniref:Uncharacterized protein n=1 Tax=Oryza meyeriana var. granulata TaxID=110450 RepID=A0A6G1CUT1_9ORYZ|nr:hypothetical protein E2562_028347 [Oryza meyeriana var. granulata]